MAAGKVRVKKRLRTPRGSFLDGFPHTQISTMQMKTSVNAMALKRSHPIAMAGTVRNAGS